MAWLRLDDGVVDNPKVQRLPLLLFRAWINCLCIAKKHGGALADMADVAYRLHITEKRAAEIVKQLIDAGLFEECNGQIVPHDWTDWQFQSDVSTDRVKRFRQRERNANETFHETFQRNKDETDHIHITETDTEQRQKHIHTQKAAFGQFGNVMLSVLEKDKLDSLFGADGTLQRIETLSEYIASKGIKYKSHYATILTWDRKNGVNGSGKPQERESYSERVARKNRELRERLLNPHGDSDKPIH